MYFIVNKDSYIIAASKDFLESIGSRDMCAVSLFVKNQQIVIDKDNHEVQVSGSNYIYNKSSMYSAFGDLTLYSLTQKSALAIEEDDENIAYLRKIKEGVVTKDDNTFAIPAINRDTTKSSKLVDNSYNEVVDTKEELVKTPAVDTIEQEIEEAKNRVEIHNYAEPKEVKEDIKHVVEEKVEDTKDKIVDIKDTIVKKVEDAKELVEEKVVDTKKAIENKVVDAKETIEDKVKDVKDEFTNEAITTDTTEHINKYDISEEPKEAIEEKDFISTLEEESKKAQDEIHENKKEKVSAIEKIKSKLFPWGSSHKEEKIELEDNTDVLTTASELADDTKESIKDKVKIVEDEITIEDIEKQELIDEAKEQELKEAFETTTEKVEAKTDNFIEHAKEEAEEKLEIEPLVDTTKERELTLEEEELLILKDIHKEKESIETDVIKEEIAKVEPKKEEKLEIVEDKVVEHKEHRDVNVNDALIHKLVSLQVDSIDLQKNANKLSIDLDNYKLLLNNYLDELDNYKDELENGSKSTISMLTDASQLLSLDTITNKLEAIGNNSANKNTLLELNMIKELLRKKVKGETTKEPVEKVETFKSETKVVQEPVRTVEKVIPTPEPKVVETFKESIPPIPKEAIAITSSTELLSKIGTAKVDFDPTKAANELNLPKTLILEFVNDFIAQAKDHLEPLVEAYKSDDIKTMQTTAHMLKGAASNLRLDSIAEILFKIQKENSISHSGELLKDFVSKLKGLELEVERFEKVDNED